VNDIPPSESVSPPPSPSQEGDSTPAAPEPSIGNIFGDVPAPDAPMTSEQSTATPAKGKKGGWRPGAGRKPKPRDGGMDADQRALLSGVDVTAPPPLIPVPPKKSARPADYENMGNLAAGWWFSGGEVLFGPDWKPNDAEEKQIPKAFAEYFRAKGLADIPPGVALALGLGMYSVTRFTRPTVKQRMLGGLAWGRDKVRGWFRRER